MHGRIKVRTSEEEKLRKLKEQSEKLKVFQHAMKIIQLKRKNGELDEELLTITASVLLSNPDISTLWNIRKQVLLIFNDLKEKEQLSMIYDDELFLTECCLKVNPKSYYAWYQREWVLLTRKDPDWKKEIQLCDMYLKLDERNFHTWDYRRFIISQYKPPLEEEFKFTTEKLYENFSNYSAWHYRSKMLVALYPDLEAGRPIEDKHHKKELEMVQSAAFTDPDDTSAWFYQRWLLGAVKENKSIVVCTVTPNKLTVAFNKYVSKDTVENETKVIVGEQTITGTWLSNTGNEFDNLWVLKNAPALSGDASVNIIYNIDKEHKQRIECVRIKAGLYVGKGQISFQKQYSEPVAEELRKQLDSCRQLLDLEPDNRWTLLTTTVLLYCLDQKTHYKEIINNLRILKTLDKLRSGYYDDLITKWSMEHQIMSDFTTNSLDFEVKFDNKLTSLPYLHYYSYCENVDLSNQNLRDNALPTLSVLKNCKILNLEGNQITSLKKFPNMDQLTHMNLNENVIGEKEVIVFKEKHNLI